MKQKILKLLNYTNEQYEDAILLIYIRWCMDFSANYTSGLQCVIANTAINSFFLNELSKIEADFIEQMKPYENDGNISAEDSKKTFYRLSVQLFNRYPKALLADAKKMNLYASN